MKSSRKYFLFYNPKGTMPNDVWDIIPEDTQHRKMHFAPYPEELSKLLGLNAEANVGFEEIAKILETKISDSTVFSVT